MAKAFSLLSWNIEHLRDKPAKRIEDIVSVLKDESPDVFALYEVEGKKIYSALTEKMPKYAFHITEGPQTQEILVGVNHKFTSFFSQRVEFKAGNSRLRPGALLTIKVDGKDYSIMVLHLKSLTKPVGFGIRDEQFGNVQKLKKKLDEKVNGNANFIVLGDFNTMGMDYRAKKHDIPADAELHKLELDLKKKSVSMVRLTKTVSLTWNNGSKSRTPPSNLDHVLASQHLTFKMWDNKSFANQPEKVGKSQVDVRGWVDLNSNAAQDAWIKKYSDHSYMYLEVNRV